MTRDDFDRHMAEAGITDEHWAAATRHATGVFRADHARGIDRLDRIRSRFPGFGRRQEIA